MVFSLCCEPEIHAGRATHGPASGSIGRLFASRTSWNQWSGRTTTKLVFREVFTFKKLVGVTPCHGWAWIRTNRGETPDQPDAAEVMWSFMPCSVVQ